MGKGSTLPVFEVHTTVQLVQDSYKYIRKKSQTFPGLSRNLFLCFQGSIGIFLGFAK